MALGGVHGPGVLRRAGSQTAPQQLGRRLLQGEAPGVVHGLLRLSDHPHGGGQVVLGERALLAGAVESGQSQQAALGDQRVRSGGRQLPLDHAGQPPVVVTAQDGDMRPGVGEGAGERPAVRVAVPTADGERHPASARPCPCPR